MTTPAVGLERAVKRLMAEDADHVELRRRTGEELRRLVPFDVAVLATVDPTTVMWTHCLLDGMPRDEQLERDVFRNEYGEEDVLKLHSLSSVPGHVGILSDRAREGSVSRRLEEIYRPAGISDELRLLLVDRSGSPWGALVLLRADGRFASEDAEGLSLVGPDLAGLLRHALLKEAAQDPGDLDQPPGMILCDALGNVLEVTDEAQALIGPRRGDIPQVVHALLASLDAGGRGEAAMPGPDGQWLTFHGGRLGEQRIVIVERVRPHRLAEIIVRAHGLTAREREVVEHVARGESTREIADALSISEWTVQDHLKTIFAKFGVRSRQALVAAIFFDHYSPRHAREDTPSPYGWYLDR